ncbi:C40 family peptidase [Indiicoccus explosivorum]|uniref:C40 family peptidase n=1 Tax=Indiicoccus explosivorum TaxID=1917864 RepID=UPI000B438D9B|nr:C40 family peptidase [Indiicoccus explosivorum]
MNKRIIWVIVFALILSAAPLLPKKASAATPDEIASYAQQFLGTPYRFGGTTPSGFDCSGYIRYVFNHFGISLPRTSAEQAGVGTAVSKSDLQKGDLVFFANTYKPGISHTGIYIGNGNVISAESDGVSISNINTNPYWGPKYATARRLSSVSTPAPAPAPEPAPIVLDGEFKDVGTGHAAYEAIKAMNLDGVVNGYSNTEFKPDASVTRGQAAEMVNRVLGLSASGGAKFSDVGTTHRFADSINAMAEAGILMGYSNGRYGVDDTLTKAQLAIIMDRAFKITGYETAQVQTATFYYDVDPSFWAHDAIVALKSIDQTSVFQSSNYQSKTNATRAEFTAAVYSALEAS